VQDMLHTLPGPAQQAIRESLPAARAGDDPDRGADADRTQAHRQPAAQPVGADREPGGGGG
jgi:hypothetical protein